MPVAIGVESLTVSKLGGLVYAATTLEEPPLVNAHCDEHCSWVLDTRPKPWSRRIAQNDL